MENTTNKKLTEAQVNELAELMKGEHGETIKTYAENNFRAGQGAGAIGGLMYAGLGALCVGITVRAAKAAWEIGKDFVKFVKGDAS